MEKEGVLNSILWRIMENESLINYFYLSIFREFL
jgi:hypothetical protein